MLGVWNSMPPRTSIVGSKRKRQRSIDETERGVASAMAATQVAVETLINAKDQQTAAHARRRRSSGGRTGGRPRDTKAKAKRKAEAARKRQRRVNDAMAAVAHSAVAGAVKSAAEVAGIASDCDENDDDECDDGSEDEDDGENDDDDDAADDGDDDDDDDDGGAGGDTAAAVEKRKSLVRVDALTPFAQRMASTV